MNVESRIRVVKRDEIDKTCPWCWHGKCHDTCALFMDDHGEGGDCAIVVLARNLETSNLELTEIRREGTDADD